MPWDRLEIIMHSSTKIHVVVGGKFLNKRPGGFEVFVRLTSHETAGNRPNNKRIHSIKTNNVPPQFFGAECMHDIRLEIGRSVEHNGELVNPLRLAYLRFQAHTNARCEITSSQERKKRNDDYMNGGDCWQTWRLIFTNPRYARTASKASPRTRASSLTADSSPAIFRRATLIVG